MVGSLNGRGVFESKNNGKLIATLDPRRDRMFAVRVLRSENEILRKNPLIKAERTGTARGDLLSLPVGKNCDSRLHSQGHNTVL